MRPTILELCLANHPKSIIRVLEYFRFRIVEVSNYPYFNIERR